MKGLCRVTLLLHCCEKTANWQAKRNHQGAVRYVCLWCQFSLGPSKWWCFCFYRKLFYSDCRRSFGIKIRHHPFKTSSGYTQFGPPVMMQNGEERQQLKQGVAVHSHREFTACQTFITTLWGRCCWRLCKYVKEYRGALFVWHGALPPMEWNKTVERVCTYKSHYRYPCIFKYSFAAVASYSSNI